MVELRQNWTNLIRETLKLLFYIGSLYPVNHIFSVVVCPSSTLSNKIKVVILTVVFGVQGKQKYRSFQIQNKSDR